MHQHLKVDLGGDLIERGITGLLNQLSAIKAQLDRVEGKIDKLSGDTITPADQARIDALFTAGTNLVARIKAADALTPPKT